MTLTERVMEVLGAFGTLLVDVQPTGADPVPVGMGHLPVRPDGGPAKPPLLVVHLVDWARFGQPGFDNTEDSMQYTFQVDAVALRADQAILLTGWVRDRVLGRDQERRLLHPLALSGQHEVDRQEAEAVAGDAPATAGVVSRMTRFNVATSI